MKINFNAEYSQIAERVRAQSRPNDLASKQNFQFEHLIAELAPKAAQPIEEKQQSIGSLSSKAEQNIAKDDIRARFDFSKPTIEPPTAGRIDGSLAPDATTGISSGGVKRPTLLAVTRVAPGSVDLSAMKPDARFEAAKKIIEPLANKHGIDPAIGLAVAQVESGFNSSAVSSDGMYSKGLFQLLDRTAADAIEREEYSCEYDPFNPEQNSDLGLSHLKYLKAIFSKETELQNNTKTVAAANPSSLEKLALAAFNAGEGRVASAQARSKGAGLDPSEYSNIEAYLPDITQNYVQKVSSLKDHFNPNS